MKTSGEELEKAVENALDELFKNAKGVEIDESKIKSPSLLEPVVEDMEDPSKELEELIGEVLTLEWEILPEISQKALRRCSFLKEKLKDATSRKLLGWLEKSLQRIRNLEKVTPQDIELIQKIGNALYKYHFEKEDIQEELKEIEKSFKEKTLEIPEDKKSEKVLLKKELKEVVNYLLKEYQKLTAMEELLRQGKEKAAQKLISNSKQEIYKILTGIHPAYENKLEEKEKEIKGFVRKKEEKGVLLEVREGLLCADADRHIFIPLEEVGYVGEIRDSWRPYLRKGIFPLKLLKGEGLLKQIFGKIRSELQGELADKKEGELKKMELPVAKPLDLETRMVIIWKNDYGLVWPVKDCEFITLKEKIFWKAAEKPFQGKAQIQEKEVYLLAVGKLPEKNK